MEIGAKGCVFSFMETIKTSYLYYISWEKYVNYEIFTYDIWIHAIYL